MPPKSATKPQKAASNKRARKDSAGAGNQTLDNYVTKKPRTSKKDENSTSPSNPEEPLEGSQEDEFGDEDEETAGLPKGRSGKNQLDQTLPPISDIDAAFWDIAKRSAELLDEKNGNLVLRIATMCSGTEAPIMALREIRDIWEKMQPGRQFLEFLHVFSAEIVRFKQAYIMRNTDGTIVYNDVQDFIDPKDGMAPTAMGSFEKIPGDVDILVSGCSCVDFSSLNTKKTNTYTPVNLKEEYSHIGKLSKENGYDDTEYARIDKFFQACLEATPGMGSSAKTFFSMLSYIRDYRPKVVILENVLMAPWAEMEKVWFPFLGYTAYHTKLDTKDFYIPQTRTRGYLLAMDNTIFAKGKKYPKKEPKGEDVQKNGKASKKTKAEKEAEKRAQEDEDLRWDAGKIGSMWLHLLKNVLPRRASSPVLMWLLPPAHPLTERARQDDSEKTLGFGTETDWQRSKIIHIRTRRKEGLGNSRDITKWGIRNGQPYDRMDKNVLESIPDRVKDCIEINFLRGLKTYLNGIQRCVYDSRFKNRISDLSQNIHRSDFGTPLGITGCLTPSGIHFMSDQCRMVSGYETLALQGLPLHRVEFATETQEQLRDLAGNAMSTTVVGAVLVALFRAVCSQPEGPQKYFNRELEPKTKKEPRLTVVPKLKEIPEFSTMDAQSLNASTIRELYARSRRYCFCNGAAKYSTDDFMKCSRCLTIRCKWCAGNPEHSFQRTERPADYLLLSEVEQEVMRFFPGTITGMTTANWLPTLNSHTEVTIADVKEALEKLRDVTFYYESIRITEVVTVCYSGQWGFDVRAKLSDMGITWYLYLDPWSKTGNALQDTIKCVDPTLATEYVRSPQPIAKAELFDNSPSVFPQPHTWKLWHFVNIRMKVSVDTQEKDLLKITKIDIKYPKSAQDQLDLDDVYGSYHHYKTCDGPEQSLHAQDKKVFLFKDVSRTLTPDLDGYVISKSCRQLEYHEYREILMKFDTRVNLSQWETGYVDACVGGYWKESRFGGADNFVEGQKFTIFKNVEKMKVFGSRHSIVENEEPEQLILAEAKIVREMECDPYKAITKYKAQCEDATDGWAVVNKADLHHLHGFISHVNVKLAGIEDLEISFELKDIEAWLDKFKNWKDGVFAANPRQCPYGQLPPIRWIKVGNKYVGHHLTDAMADFEERFKTRIPIFEPRVQALPNPDASGKMHAIRVQYLFQHKVLGQRAAVFLPPTRDPTARVTAGVQVERNAVLSENMQVNSNGGSRHKFEPFRNALRSLGEFPYGMEPALQTFQGQLTQSQLRSLAWILDRERNNPKFTEQEIEEEIVPELKLRLAGWAKRIVTNHGGVLADDVGYGKTVVMLASAHCQQVFDSEKSFQQRETEKPHCNYLKATLVVVPGHLVDQWATEALHFLPIKSSEIFKIKSISDLQDNASQAVLGRLRAARIIVVTNKLFEPRYNQRLASLAGSLDPPDSSLIKDQDSASSRSFVDWYEDAAPAARAHVSALLSSPEPKIQEVWGDMNARTERLRDEYKVYANDLSRRRGKARNMEGKDGEDGVVETNLQASQRITSWQELDSEWQKGGFLHVLDEFTFARAVYDEFSYENFSAMTFFVNCSAHAKWILSATPPTRNLQAVQGIANLVNIHIARPIYSRVGMPRITVGPAFGEQTNAEALQNRKLMSDSCIRERHEKGMEFLKTFATSNPLDAVFAGSIRVEEKVIVCELNKHEAIEYMALEHDLRACGLDANMLPGACRTRLQTLVKLNEWFEDGRNVAVRLFLARSSCSLDGQSLESLRQERRDQAQHATAVFRIHLEKAIWLAWRVLTNDKECSFSNATTAAQDISMILKDIWCRDTEICGGLDSWRQIFEALNVGSYEDRFNELVRNHPNFLDDDKELLRFMYGLRQSSWNDYFDLEDKHLAGIKEEEANELLTDLLKTFGNTSVVSNNPTESKKNQLAALLGGQGLARFRRAEASTVRRPTPGEMPSLPKSKSNKTFLTNLLKSLGVVPIKDPTTDQLKARLEAHYNGTLDDSEYVEMNDSRAMKRTEFPNFDKRIIIRGGKYTATSSETSDTSVGLRAAFDNLAHVIKQKRIVENLVSEEERLRCDNCAQLKPRNDLHIVCECGHVLCADHLHYKYCGDNSPNGASGCKSSLADATKSLALIDKPQRSLNDVPSTQQDQITGISSKSQMIANCIKGIPEDDQAILFFQFDNQKEELKKTLDKNNITYTESPTESPNDSNKCKVRFLNLNDQSSSGTNLQEANHVMFVCPLLRALQEQYDSDMKQAKGRCVRFGQKKVVHVYHFVTAHTIEVDMLELRRQSHVLVRPGEAVGRLRHVPLVQGVEATNPASASQVVNGDVTNGEERVRSVLTSSEIWKAMNESNWLNTVGIEY